MKVNFKSSTVLLILVVGPIAAGPVADPVEIDDVEAGTRDETEPLGDFVAELRDSLVVPLLLNPFEVNKLTCGSIITFYDNSAGADATVAVDLCLTALLLAKVNPIYANASYLFQLISVDCDRADDLVQHGR